MVTKLKTNPIKNFSIKVISKKPKKIYGLLSHTGEITIGDFKETFIMPIENWNLESYQQQWSEGLQKIATHNTSCLITSVQNIDANPSIELWALYRKNNTIFIQNQLIIDETVTKNLIKELPKFNKKNCYQFINPRIANENNEGINEEGETISEWHIDLKSILSAL